MRLSSKVFKIIAVILLAVIAVGVYILLHWGEEETDDATIESHIVTVAPKVGGYVTRLLIDDNQFVKKGDLLAEIDPRDYRIRRDHARAMLLAAQASFNASNRSFETTRISAPSTLDAAQAQVSAAEANWKKAHNDLKRLQSVSSEARSREQLDAAVAADKTAYSNWEDAKARLRSAGTAPKTIAGAKATAEQLAAEVKVAEADLALAEQDLSDTQLLAPMDGRITMRAAEQGDYAQPGQNLTSIVSPNLWVIANYKETQLAHMRVGQRVSLRIDALPGVTIEGKIDSFQSGTGARFSPFPPENATGNYVKIVQRVPVKILITSPLDSPVPIGPGMSVTPVVFTAAP